VKAMLILCSIIVFYACFNLVLSGTVLPNTFYAKLAYYKNGNTNFWAQLWTLIAGGGRIIPFALAVGGIVWMFTEKKRGNTVLILYPLGMAFLYHWKLPYLYQDGRYLIPILPFIVLLAAIGSSRTASWFAKSTSVASILSIILILVAAIGGFNSMSDTLDNLSFEESYIHNLQVETAQWCAKNLPASAVITTHDIGALGYYSGRRVVDLVGLADPGMIKFLDKPGAVNALRKKGVSLPHCSTTGMKSLTRIPSSLIRLQRARRCAFITSPIRLVSQEGKYFPSTNIFMVFCAAKIPARSMKP
jgi:hypothetical protein